jgi:hypothetical protein
MIPLLHKLDKDHEEKAKVPPRFELGSLDSESKVLTITPWNLYIWTA